MPEPTVIPPDFLSRHNLLHRLYLAPLRGLTPPTPWAPLTDAEWDALAPILADLGCGLSTAPRAGRPAEDPRARLDAIFRAVTLKHPDGGRAPWRMLPEAFGKPDTASRTHRRWARAGLWARLLVEVAHPDRPPVLAALTHRICCAFRRAIRQMGLRAIVLARRLGLHSALPAPSQYLPDPDLSEIVWPLQTRLVESMLANPGWRPPPLLFRALRGLLTLCAGRARTPRWMEPA
jgi:transposase